MQLRKLSRKSKRPKTGKGQKSARPKTGKKKGKSASSSIDLALSAKDETEPDFYPESKKKLSPKKSFHGS